MSISPTAQHMATSHPSVVLSYAAQHMTEREEGKLDRERELMECMY